MTKEEIVTKILGILKDEFEIDNPDHDENLTEKYEFDSIDAIALLEMIEDMLGFPIEQEDKKRAMEIRNVNQIVDFIESLLKKQSNQ